MTDVLDAFRKALRDLFRPPVLIMVVVPIVCAMALWTFAAWLFWEPLTQWVGGLLLSFKVGQWIDNWSHAVLQFFSVLITLALLAPGVVVTAMLITEFFTMPGLVNFVAQRYYPALAREHGGTLAAGIANSVIAITIFAVLWLVTLPLWFTGIGALLVPLVISAYLNQRMFRHDAVADHANRAELRALNRNGRRRLFFLGLLPAVFLYVPLVNLLAPALTGLAFTHYQLGRLARLRAQPPASLAP